MGCRELPAKKKGLFSIYASDLMRAFKTVTHAVSMDQTRMVLNGVYVVVSDDKVEFVATDGRRLSITSIPFAGGCDAKIIIPTQAINMFMRLGIEDDSDVVVSIEEGAVSFECGNVLLRSKIIDGVYPNYNQVVPTDETNHASIPIADFEATIKRVATITAKDSDTIIFDLQHDKCVIEAEELGIGRAVDSVPVDSNVQLRFAANARFVLDLLKVLDGDNVTLYVQDELSPLLFADNASKHVVMPVRAK